MIRGLLIDIPTNDYEGDYYYLSICLRIFMVANMYMLRLHVKVLSSSYLCFTIMPNELKKGFHELPSQVPTVSRGDGFVI